MFHSSFLCFVLMALIATLQSSAADVFVSMPSFLKRKAHYTPLLFFKVPPGTMGECKLK